MPTTTSATCSRCAGDGVRILGSSRNAGARGAEQIFLRTCRDARGAEQIFLRTYRDARGAKQIFLRTYRDARRAEQTSFARVSRRQEVRA